jgi:hypothetical protein
MLIIKFLQRNQSGCWILPKPEAPQGTVKQMPCLLRNADCHFYKFKYLEIKKIERFLTRFISSCQHDIVPQQCPQKLHAVERALVQPEQRQEVGHQVFHYFLMCLVRVAL